MLSGTPRINGGGGGGTVSGLGTADRIAFWDSASSISSNSSLQWINASGYFIVNPTGGVSDGRVLIGTTTPATVLGTETLQTIDCTTGFAGTTYVCGSGYEINLYTEGGQTGNIRYYDTTALPAGGLFIASNKTLGLSTWSSTSAITLGSGGDGNAIMWVQGATAAQTVSIGTSQTTARLYVESELGLGKFALQVVQNDSTGNPVAAQITNAGSGSSLNIDHNSTSASGASNITVLSSSKTTEDVVYKGKWNSITFVNAGIPKTVYQADITSSGSDASGALYYGYKFNTMTNSGGAQVNAFYAGALTQGGAGTARAFSNSTGWEYFLYGNSGKLHWTLGSDATGDTYYRDAGGDIVRLGIGSTDQTMQVSAGGTPAWGAIVQSGTHTPTLTNGTNVSASTAYQCQYMRVGSTVTVSGKVDIDLTATGAYEVGMSLPIASNFGATEDCAGVGIGTTTSPAASDSLYIMADTANDRASLNGNDNDTSNHTHYFTFTYQII